MMSERFEQALPPPLHYDGSLPRRVRKAWRFVHGTTTAALAHRTPVHIRAFWWDGHPNFGDGLTPWLLPRYGIVPVHTSATQASLVGIGSVLEMVPSEFQGAVWGAGLMTDAPRLLPRSRFLAVRGHLTRERLGLSSAVTVGDPGLLVSRHLGRPETSVTLAAVPHGIHAGHPVFACLAGRNPNDVRMVDVRQSPAHVARRIAGATAVVTSSLHGLVYADSFGIPAMWITLDPPLRGGEFKFKDYESVVKPNSSRRFDLQADSRVTDLLEKARAIPRDVVSQVSEELERALLDFREEVRSTRSVIHGRRCS